MIFQNSFEFAEYQIYFLTSHGFTQKHILNIRKMKFDKRELCTILFNDIKRSFQ